MIRKESLFKSKIVLGTRISSFFFFITLKSVCVVISNFKHFSFSCFLKLLLATEWYAGTFRLLHSGSIAKK